MIDEDDPLSDLRVDKEKFDRDASKFRKGEPLFEGASSPLKSNEADQFSNKSSVQQEKGKTNKKEISTADNVTDQKKKQIQKNSEKGLGFNNTISAMSDSIGDVRIQANALKGFDILDDLADKEKLSDVSMGIFATLTEDNKGKNNEVDDLFGTKVTPSSSHAGKLRVGRQIENESTINDLTNSKVFLEKETDDNLNFDVFGISKTKQEILKQQAAAVSTTSKEEAVLKELTPLGLGDESTLDKLEALTIASDTDKASSREPTGATKSTSEVITDIDMDKLDIDAYISSMSSSGDKGSEGGGGLFD